MYSNFELLNILRCPVCTSHKLSNFSVGDGLKCEACDGVFPNKVGAVDFLSEEQRGQLVKLIQLNVDDRLGESASSNRRQHDKDVYVDGGYALRLEEELALTPGAVVADLGCGRGQISEYFCNRGFNVLSVDVVEENLADCANKNKIFATVDKLPIQDNSLDAIICTDVIEHIYPETQPIVLNEFLRTLKPGGKLLISYPGSMLPPHTGNYLINVMIWILRLFGARMDYMATGKEYGGAAHINIRTPWRITREFKSAGFEGRIVPFTNKFFSLSGRVASMAKLLNTPIIRIFFISNMHGLLIKPLEK